MQEAYQAHRAPEGSTEGPPTWISLEPIGRTTWTSRAAPLAKMRRHRRHAPCTEALDIMKTIGRLGYTLLLATLAACAPATEDAESSAAQATERVPALDRTQRSQLASAGFTEKEIQAVADSIDISKWLAVQSFVNEANDGYATADASVRRESHGKHQGCLRAKVEVTTSGGVGVFQEGKSYPAWIRLSNGGAFQRSDGGKHISRGWGLKLLGVDGTDERTQDFLFITSPRFFISDITHYPSFLEASGNGRFGLITNLLFKMSWDEKQVILHRLGLRVSNLLESPEYSAVPYAYGDETVKYALAPCGGSPPITPSSRPPPDGASDDYLEEAMNASLESTDSKSGVCYGFFVQRPKSGDSVENPTKAWEGSFEEVATITIPHGQHRGAKLDYTKNDAECERMAFDPWNTRAEHGPRGKTNWTRKLVYAALSWFRRVEMPKAYARWLANHDDTSVPAEWRKELARLRNPEALAPRVKDTAEPVIDDGFRALGIVD